MYCLPLGLLLTLFIATAVNCQSCESARRALTSNQTCVQAFSEIRDAIDAERSINQRQLNAYCQPGCRNLVNAVITCDNDPDAELGLRSNQFICTTENGMSCYDLISSGRFDQMANAFEASGACNEILLDGQMCSSTCRTAFQNFVNDGGCCVAEVFEFASQFADEDLMETLRQCPIDLSQAGTCVEIGGGASGLKAFVSVLLLAVTLALVSI